jgi:hypothetical protein
VRPGGRPLEERAVAALHQLATPKRARWRVPEPDPAAWRPDAAPWPELAPVAAWAEADR